MGSVIIALTRRYNSISSDIQGGVIQCSLHGIKKVLNITLFFLLKKVPEGKSAISCQVQLNG